MQDANASAQPATEAATADGQTEAQAAAPSAAANAARVAEALRDLEGAKARVERDAKQVANDTRKRLVIELLPVMDNLDRTIAAAGSHGEAPAVVEGVRLVRSQLEAVLRGYGVERLDAQHRRFDPAIHEAVTLTPVRAAAQDGLVVDQLEPGYTFGGALLRPAKVVVGKLAAHVAPVQPPRPVEPLLPEPPARFGAPRVAPPPRFVDPFGPRFGRRW